MKDKRRVCFILGVILVASLLLCACGKPRPNTNRIKNDLATASEFDFCDVTSVSITMSDSSLKNRFEASFTFKGKDSFAEYEGTGDITYKLYDQGWVVQSCNAAVTDVSIKDYSGFAGEYSITYGGYDNSGIMRIDEINEKAVIFEVNRKKYNWPFSEVWWGGHSLFIVYESEDTIKQTYNHYHLTLEYPLVDGRDIEFTMMTEPQTKWDRDRHYTTYSGFKNN